MRGDGERRLFGSRFVAVIAIQFPAIGQRVFIYVVRMLLAIEVCVEIAPRGEITLWRERGELMDMTDGAGLTQSKLRDVALNAGVVPWKIQL
jgi:hypothetical protein